MFLKSVTIKLRKNDSNKVTLSIYEGIQKCNSMQDIVEK